jgi:hypothetical protein
MIQVDLPAAFAIGQTFSLLSKKYLKKESDILTGKLLGPFNLYLSCGFALGGLFLLVGWPAWEGMYTVQWLENTFDNPGVAALYVFFYMGMILLGNAGFMLGHYFYQKNRDNWVIGGIIIGVILTLLPFALRWGCWMRIGTFDAVTAGGGYSFGKPPFFIGWLVMMLYLFGAGIGAGIWFIRAGRKLSETLPDK